MQDGQSSGGFTPDQQRILERLRLVPLFDGFLESHLRSLVPLAEIVELPSGFEVLKEGQMNHHLHFLLSGRVGVFLQGERIASLERAGDLLGEMSVITSQPCTATIIAETDLELILVKSGDLLRVTAPREDDFAFLLHRKYARILSEKLILTNDKARRFELANKDLVDAKQALERANQELELKVQERTADLRRKTDALERSYLDLEAQNTELLASHRKLEDLSSSKEMMFARLSTLYKNHLSPLANQLQDLGKAPEGADPAVLAAAHELQQALTMIEPLTALYSTEQAIKSKRVLLAESNKKQQIVARLALGGTGVQLDIAENLESGREMLANGGYELLFVSAELAELAKEAQEREPGCKLVLMTSTDVPSYLPVLKQAPFLTNIVSRDEEDRTFTVKNIMTTVTKLLTRDLFGLEKYLIWGVDVRSHAVTRSDERASLIETMEQHFSQLGVRSRISERCAVVAEELLMNAIYDAPVDPQGRSLYNHVDRKVGVALKPREQGEFRYACDGMLAAISVSDPFGGFRLPVLLNYLDGCYAGTGAQEEGKGGAGRGLHQIIENADLIVFNIKPGVRTEVIALFNLDLQKQKEGFQPSFHFFLG